MAATRRIQTRQVTANSNRVSSTNQQGECQSSPSVVQQPPFQGTNSGTQRSHTPDGHQYISDLPGPSAMSTELPLAAAEAAVAAAAPLMDRTIPSGDVATMRSINDTSGPLPRETSAGTLVVVGSPLRRGKELARMTMAASSTAAAAAAATSRNAAPGTKGRKPVKTARKKNAKVTTSTGASATVGSFSCTTTSSGKKRIRTPSSDDVLFGRGGFINKHPGNKTFREVVSRYKDDYNKLSANKTEKNHISQLVVAEVKGKFLIKTACGGWWEEVDDVKALSKTSQALREGAPLIRAQGTTGNRSAASSSPSKAGIARNKRRRPQSKRTQEETKLDAPKVIHPTIVPIGDGHRGKQLIRPKDLTEDNDQDPRPNKKGRLAETLDEIPPKEEMTATVASSKQEDHPITSTISDEIVDDQPIPMTSSAKHDSDNFDIDELFDAFPLNSSDTNAPLDDEQNVARLVPLSEVDSNQESAATVTSSTSFAATSLGEDIVNVKKSGNNIEEIVSTVQIPETHLDPSSSLGFHQDLKESATSSVSKDMRKLDPRSVATPDLLPQSGPHTNIENLSLCSTTAVSLDFPPQSPSRLHSISYSAFGDDEHDFTNRVPFSDPFETDFTEYDNLEDTNHQILDSQDSSDVVRQDEAMSPKANNRA